MNIIVTGASRGIGYEVVKLLCQQGNHSILAISRNIAGLKDLQSRCLAINAAARVIPLQLDLSRNDLETIIAAAVKKELDTVNVLINNAGAILNKPFNKIALEEMQAIYNVNVFSPLRLIRSVMPHFDPASRSHVVNISSMGGFQGAAKFAGLSVYSSSKAALACATECLAEEFKELNVSFNCLALGSAQTEMLAEAFPGYKAPLSAAEMAEYVAGFALTAQNYMNGKIIPVSLTNP